MDTPEPTISISIKVPSRLVQGYLISAFEGGSNYWCRLEKKVLPSVDLGKLEYYQIPFTTDGALKLSDAHASDKPKTRTLNARSIARGLKIMAREYPRHFGNLVNDTGDAETGDVLLQLCLFGELVYG